MIELTVIGIPAPQGSKSFKGIRSGKAILVESSKRVKPWREAVVWAARELHLAAPLEGPLAYEMIFTLPKPKSAPKKRTTWPSARPDISKIQRSTEDSLTDAGIWRDDSQVVFSIACKTFPGQRGIFTVGAATLFSEPLDVPGAIIRIWRVE